MEDHEFVRNAIAKILREIPSFEFAFDAANGQEFLDQLNEKEIDVVLLDLEMPVLHRIETDLTHKTKFILQFSSFKSAPIVKFTSINTRIYSKFNPFTRKLRCIL